MTGTWDWNGDEACDWGRVNRPDPNRKRWRDMFYW